MTGDPRYQNNSIYYNSKNNCQQNNESTNAAIRRTCFFINKQYAAINEEAIMVFADILKMFIFTDDTKLSRKWGRGCADFPS